MIVTKDLECFKDFIADVEEAKVSFRILGYLADEALPQHSSRAVTTRRAVLWDVCCCAAV